MILKFNCKLQNQIKIEFNYKANSIYSRIQPMIAKSKKVKVKSQGKSKTHQSAGLYQTKVRRSGRIPGPVCTDPQYDLIMGAYTRRRAGSWKLGAELEAAKI